METLYFIAMVASVGWLMAWVAMPPGGRGRLWWPFDMKEDAAPPPEREPPDGPRAPPDGTPLSWRDRTALAGAGAGAAGASRRGSSSRRRGSS